MNNEGQKKNLEEERISIFVLYSEAHPEPSQISKIWHFAKHPLTISTKMSILDV